MRSPSKEPCSKIDGNIIAHTAFILTNILYVVIISTMVYAKKYQVEDDEARPYILGGSSLYRTRRRPAAFPVIFDGGIRALKQKKE